MTFKDLIEEASDEYLIEVCEKLYAEDVAFFLEYLPPSRSNSDLVHTLYEEIDNLPIATLNKILRNRETVLVKELNNMSPDFEIVVNNILRLSSKYSPDLQFSTVIKAINDPVVSKKVKLKFAIYLSNINSIDKEVFNKITEEYHFCLPALINRLKYSHPFDALESLDKHLDESDKFILRPLVRSLLLNLLSLEPFNTFNYEEFIYFIDAANESTKKIISEVLRLPQLKAIDEKLNSFSNKLLENRLGEIFTPLELESAKTVVKSFSVQKKIQPPDVLSVNINAAVFFIIGEIENGAQDRIKGMGSIFMEFDRVYKEKFHLYLRKYGATYDPVIHEVYFGDQIYPFNIEPEIFRNAQQELLERYGRQRLSIANKEI